MSEDRAGKSSIMMVLDIIRKYSDEDHRLSQTDIQKKLESDYGINADRKTVRRNLERLIEYDDRVLYEEKTRGKDTLLTDFRYERDFTDAELHMLINSVICSPYIKAKDAADLSGRLRALTSVYFHDKTSKIGAVYGAADINPEFELSMEELHQAIQEEKQVTFCYSRYCADKKLHVNTKDGEPRVYMVNPYRVVDVNGRAYLICNTVPHDGVSNYRVDKMTGVRVTDVPARPVREMPGLESGLLDLPRYLSEHLNMSFYETVNAVFRFDTEFANVVIDTFGTRLEVINTDPETTVARIRIDCEAMCTWALQYPDRVRVLEPEDLVDRIRERFAAGRSNYEN